jgi:hypothetical protein
MKRIISPEIDPVVEWSTLSLKEEDGKFVSAVKREYEVASGFVATACYQRIPCEQGRSGKFPKGVGATKPGKRGCADALSEVGLIDGALRQGEPAAGGSDQRDLDPSKET